MNTEYEALLEKVLAFIRREVPPPREINLSLATDLRSDLRILEDDADVLLAKFFEEFSVTPGDFDFSRYFPSEGLWPLFRLKKSPSPAPLTIGMLVMAAKNGAWVSQELESYQFPGNE